MNEILDLPQTPEYRKLPYAGFWIRVGAYVIDSIILAIADFAIGSAFFDGYSFLENDLTTTLVSLGMGLVYFTVMESSEKQGTLGKMALNLRVGDANGQRLSVANALGRYLGKFVSTIILCIGFMMVGWDDKKQGLHDKMADTYVFEV